MDLMTAEIGAAMARLEKLDAADRLDGTPRGDRLRSVSPAVGRLLQTLAVATGARVIVECGTSAGYSTLWLASAVRTTGGRVTTFEVDPRKIAMARESFVQAGVDDLVDSQQRDAAEGLADFDGNADFVFIDVEKDLYLSLLEPALRALRPGGTLVADNLISHETDLASFREAALGHPALSGLVVPIGRGELVAVKSPVA